VEVGDAVSSILVLGSSATLVMTLATPASLRERQGRRSDIGKFISAAPEIKVESFKDKTFTAR